MSKLCLNKNLRALMDERKISSRQLATMVDLPASTLSSMLAGKQQHRPEQILKLAEFFDVSLEFLLFGSDRSPSTLNEVQVEEFLRDGFALKLSVRFQARERFSVQESAIDAKCNALPGQAAN